MKDVFPWSFINFPLLQHRQMAGTSKTESSALIPAGKAEKVNAPPVHSSLHKEQLRFHHIRCGFFASQPNSHRFEVDRIQKF